MWNPVAIPATVLAVPTNLAASVLDTGNVLLSWEYDSDQTIDGFSILCTVDGIEDLIENIDASARSYEDSSNAGLTYQYKIKAVKDGSDDSGWSNEVEIDINDYAGAVYDISPKNNSVIEVRDDVELVWNCTCDNLSSFNLYFGNDQELVANAYVDLRHI